MNRLMVVAAAAMVALFANAKTVTVYMAPDGNDANDGSAAKPVRNLSKAVELMRLDKEADSRRIVVRDGVYSIETNVVSLGKTDANVTIEAEHPGKALFTGAVPVTGWRPYPGDRRFLTAPLPFEGKSEMLYMLTIGGENAPLAAYPDFGGENKMPYLSSQEEGLLTGNRTVMKYDRLALPKGYDFRDLDIKSAWATVPQEWVTTRSYILTNDWQNDTFVYKSPMSMFIGMFNTGFQIANCLLGMRKPGMWMYEVGKNRLIYWPKAGETIETLNKNASVSRAVAFLSAFASKNLVVRGLTVEGLSSSFNTGYTAKPRPVALMFRGYPNSTNRYNVTIENCEVRACAGLGIILGYANNCRVRNCRVHDMGDGGIVTEGSSREVNVYDCVVHHTGLFNTRANAISVSSGHSEILRNTVHHTPGPGFVLWSAHSMFASNHIHHTMQSSRDGGGLYGSFMFTTLKDNYVHDVGVWSGLYCDEGGQRNLFTGNRFEGVWWPIYVHCSYGVVVSNNFFTCDDAMRFLFLDSCHCVFTRNTIRTTKMVTKDPSLNSCDEWSENRVELKQPDGSYKFAKNVTLTREPLASTVTLKVVPALAGDVIRGGAVHQGIEPAPRVGINRTKDGYFVSGTPGENWVHAAYDTTNVYFHGVYNYNALMGYDGSKRLGEEWGKHDGMKFVAKGYECTCFFHQHQQQYEGARGKDTLGRTLDVNNSCSLFGRKTGDGYCWWGLEIPLEAFGLKADRIEDLYGKKVPFNLLSYNGDHDEMRYLMQPDGDNLLTGVLAFGVRDKPDLTGVAKAELLTDEQGTITPGPMAPCGNVQIDLETSYRPRDDYGAAQGFHPRNVKFLGYVLRDRSDKASAGHRAFLMLPYTGEGPQGEGRRCQHFEQHSLRALAGRFHVHMQRWDLETFTCATKDVAWHRYRYQRGGRVNLLVDANYADGEGTVEASEIAVDRKSGVLTGHIRVKDEKGYDVWAKMAFNHQPIEVKELVSPGKGRRMVIVFDLEPVDDDIVIKAAVSEKCADDAAAKLATAGEGFDFAKASEEARRLWEPVFDADAETTGEKQTLGVYKTALYGAYVIAGQSEEKHYHVRLDHGTKVLKVTAKGVKDATSRLVSPKPKKLGKFQDGDELVLEFQ